jgi:hypothetical protein
MWGWAGRVRDFLETPDDVIGGNLAAHHVALWLTDPSGSQTTAWSEELAVMRAALSAALVADGDVADAWSVVFEYELPLEGGRRPDVVVLTGRSMAVLEFKSVAIPSQADLDQVAAYARDLSDYHQESHHRVIRPIVVATRSAPGFAADVDGITISSPEALPAYLLDVYEPGTIDLDSWLNSAYEPLPFLVDAARRIFLHEPLPHVKRALAAGIPETVELLGRLADDAAANSERVLALVGGVPGAGKTLVGLRLVYERTVQHGRATLLSGNGPLVTVLQDALKSRIFVKDIHAFIRSHALSASARPPAEHVIVFDEAQRAWDRDQMRIRRAVDSSEPDLLIQIGERIEGWATIVGLLGHGQEIHVGEEAGIGQWHTAVCAPNATQRWTVHAPPRVADDFTNVEVITHDELDLTISLRSRRAEDLHRWVALLLEGSVVLANQQARRVIDVDFEIYVTRDLEHAREYARQRYTGIPLARYGLLASSSSKRPQKYGVDNGFMATSRMNIAAWYNAPADDPKSCCALAQPATEFSAQGLELDLPIVCWGEDYAWSAEQWRLRPPRRRIPQRDPEQLLQNAYRVLLTRGRDGMVIWVPPDPDLDATEHALLAAGTRLLPTVADLAARVASHANGNGA